MKKEEMVKNTKHEVEEEHTNKAKTAELLR